MDQNYNAYYCTHMLLKQSKNWPQLVCCLDCAGEFYRGMKIQRKRDSFWRSDRFLMQFEGTQTQEFGTTIQDDLLSLWECIFVDDILRGYWTFYRLTPSTLFLSGMLTKRYITHFKRKGARVAESTIKEIAHTCVLLGSKMRERDIYCPMISTIVEMGGGLLTAEMVRKRELEISTFYDWNINFLTFYDYLEQFLMLGVLFSEEKLKWKSSEFTPSKLNTRVEGILEFFVKDQDPMLIEKLVDEIERNCLHIAKQLLKFFVTAPGGQREIAYLIIVAVRTEYLLETPDSVFLREYYKVKVREEIQFNEGVWKAIRLVAKDTTQLRFDLVIRSYTKNGKEIIPKCFAFNDPGVKNSSLVINNITTLANEAKLNKREAQNTSNLESKENRFFQGQQSINLQKVQSLTVHIPREISKRRKRKKQSELSIRSKHCYQSGVQNNSCFAFDKAKHDSPFSTADIPDDINQTCHTHFSLISKDNVYAPSLFSHMKAKFKHKIGEFEKRYSLDKRETCDGY